MNHIMPDTGGAGTAETAEDISTKDFDTAIETKQVKSDGQDKCAAPAITQDPTPSNLPARSRTLSQADRSQLGSFSRPGSAGGPGLVSRATTAVSRADIQTKSYGDERSGSLSLPDSRRVSRQQSFSNLGRFVNNSKGDGGDSTSIRSYIPTLEASGDVESLLGEVLSNYASPAWKKLDAHALGQSSYFEGVSHEVDSLDETFEREFDELEPFRPDGSNEGKATDERCASSC